mgnify:CR=1 FL=1
MKYTIICDNKDFVTLYKRGKYIASKYCVVYFRKNNKGINRMGISTGKKAGNAVIRSRCRRIIRQAYIENIANFPLGYDIIVYARAGCGDAKSTHISHFFKTKAIPFMLKSVIKQPYKPKTNSIKNR